MNHIEEIRRRTDCTVKVTASGAAAILTPLDASDGAWIQFQEVVEDIQADLADAPDFEVQPHPQHRRALPGHNGRPVYDQVMVTKIA